MGRHHGFKTRGLSKGLAVVPQGPLFEGRFGRMFREQPVFDVDDEDLNALADSMSLQRSDNNPNIPAGFTYFGQFVDHDITFETLSSLQKANDPEGLVNFRNPRFDLDSLYGRGRDDSPYLYDQNSPDDVKLLVGRVIDFDGTTRVEGQHDLPRNEQERALIGDPRNDENTFVSQLHLLLIKFHNKLVDKVMSERPQLEDDDLFKEVQRIVRWHYQWVVICDFLRRTIPEGMLDRLLVTDEDGLRKVRLRFYRPKRQPFMPVEFSAAAYRFGHSQVRGIYDLNLTVQDTPTFLPADQLPPKSNAFGFRTADFRGFRGLPPRWTMSWPFFFELDAPEGTRQPTLKIDTNIAGPLATALPDTDHSDINDFSLPRRNLIRGKRLGLPSGQWVARAMGVLKDRILTGRDLFPQSLVEQLGSQRADKLGANTPLWYYVLKEAEVQQNGERLGEVGGRIVAEVLLGLLDGDPLSFLSVQPNWTPELAEDGEFAMTDLIRFADPDAAKVHDGRPHEQGQNGGQG
jgi:hypothetical protein